MLYKTQGTCSREISFEVVDNKLTNVKFAGGCNGNLQGIGKLVEGMDISTKLLKELTVSSAAPAPPHVLISWQEL